MNDTEYRQHGGITATAIKAGRTSMRHMHAVMTSGSSDPSAALIKGLRIHTAILEPHLMDKWAVWEGATRRGKEWDAFRAAHADAEIVTRGDLDDLQRIANAVGSHRVAQSIIKQLREIERPIFWTDDQAGACQARIDGHGSDVLVEVKSTSGISPREFGRQFVNLGYDLQIGWYAHGLGTTGVKVSRVYVIAVESEAPFDVAVYEVPQWVIDRGYSEAHRIATAYRACCATMTWPGVAEYDIQPLELPDWYAGDGSNVKPPEREMEASEL